MDESNKFQAYKSKIDLFLVLFFVISCFSLWEFTIVYLHFRKDGRSFASCNWKNLSLYRYDRENSKDIDFVCGLAKSLLSSIAFSICCFAKLYRWLKTNNH
eukprot:Pgem_evm1s5716